jgi:hypothetical protein
VVWLAVAVALGAVTWYAVGAVIDPSTSGTGVLTQTQVADSLASASAAARTPATGPSSTPGPGPSPTPTPPGGAGTGQTGAGGGPASSPQPSRPATPSRPAASPAVTGGGPIPVARSWQVPGGQVGALCRGQAMSLLYATPADGWTVQVETIAPDRFALEFQRGDRDTSLQARCVNGEPVASAESDGGDEHDGGDAHPVPTPEPGRAG